MSAPHIHCLLFCMQALGRRAVLPRWQSLVVGEGEATASAAVKEVEFGELFNASAFIASMKAVGVQVILRLIASFLNPNDIYNIYGDMCVCIYIYIYREHV